MIFRITLFTVAAAFGFGATFLHDWLSARSTSAPTKSIKEPTKPIAKEPEPARDGSAEGLHQTFQMPPGEQRRAAMKRHEDALKKLDAEAALSLVLSLPPGSARDEAARSAFVRLVKTDFLKAIGWAEKHPELAAAARNDLQEALGVVAAKDGRAAWELLQRLRKTDPMISSWVLLSKWSGQNPRGAASFGMGLPPGEERDAFMKTVLRDWAQKNSAAFLAWLRTQPQDAVASYLVDIYKLDPKASWAQLLAVADVLPLEAFAQNRWADAVTAALCDDKTRADAVRSMRTITDPDLRDQTWFGAVKACAASNPTEARRYLAEIQDPSIKVLATSTIAAHLATKAPKAAIIFANEQSDDLSRSRATLSALATWMNSNPNEARRYIAENLERLDVDTVDSITNDATRHDPADFATWVLTLKPSPQQTRLLRSLSTWLHYEPEKFRTWALSQSNAPGFQNALPGLLEAAHHYYKPSSASLATVVELIKEPAARQKAAEELMQTWRTNSPAEAARWHDAQVQAGRITAVPLLAKPTINSSASQTSSESMIEVYRPSGNLSSFNPTPYRTYLYKANGRSFTVFY